MQDLLWDNTFSWNAWFRDDETLPRLQRAGYSVVGLTVGGGNGGRPATMASLEWVERTVRAQPQSYRVVRTVEDVDAARANGQLGLALNFQGTDPLEGSLDAIDEFHALGVRQMGLVWNADNLAGCSSVSPSDTGLTAFGRDLVRAMNRAGVAVDGTHAGYRTTMDAMAACDAPFFFSHGNVDAIAASYKNLKDDQIRACAQTGGVIGISGFATYLDDLQASPESMFRQVDHVCDLVGARHVGLGLDFVAKHEAFWDKFRATPQLWPGVQVSRFFPPEDVPSLRALMERAGYPADAIRAILGENWKRVCGEIWSRREERTGRG